MTNKPSLAALEARVEERHAENQRRFDRIDDNQRVMELKIDSLLATRSFTKGILKTAGWVAGAVATVVSLVVAYLRGH